MRSEVREWGLTKEIVEESAKKFNEEWEKAKEDCKLLLKRLTYNIVYDTIYYVVKKRR